MWMENGEFGYLKYNFLTFIEQNYLNNELLFYWKRLNKRVATNHTYILIKQNKMNKLAIKKK